MFKKAINCSFSFSDKLTASVTITNTGDYDGHEVVQLYIHDKVGSVTRPVKELKGFGKIFLKKGKTRIPMVEKTVVEIKNKPKTFHLKINFLNSNRWAHSITINM